MMGFGPFDHGSISLSASLSSSSSSSTLSPLAPPFTVDRFLPTSKPAAPPHVFEDHYDNWLHLHPPISTSNAIPPPNPEVIPIGTSYGYYGPQPISSPTTHLSSLSATTHGFAFGQRPEAVKSSLLEAGPYFPRYPAAIPDKNASVSKEFVYGIPNSGASPSEGSCESSYGENSSRFGHTAKHTGVWMELGRTVMPNYSNPSQLGGPAAEGFVSPVEASDVWHGNFVESFAKKAHIGSKGTASNQQDATYTASLWENAGPFNPIGSSVFVPSSVLQEVSYPRISDPEPPLKTWNPFNLNKTSFDKCFEQSDPSSTMFSCNMSGPSMETVTSKYVNSRDRPADVFNSNDNSVGCVSANVNTGGIEGNADSSRISNEMNKGYRKFSVFPPMKTDPWNLKPVVSLSYPSKEKAKLKVTQLSASKAFTSAPDTDRPGDSMGSSPEMLDQFIPAVDSPCWKGAPSSQHSPFGFVEAPVHPPLMKESEGCNDLNKQNRFPPRNVDDAVVASLKHDENKTYLETGCVKNSSSSFSWKPTSVVTFPCVEHISTDAVKSGSDCLKVSNGKGIQSSSGMQEARHKSCFELETSDLKPLSYEKDDVTCTKKPTLESRISDPRTDFNREDQNVSSDFFSHAREHEANVSSSGVSVSNEIGDMHGASDVSNYHSSGLDAQMLVKTIHNLLELLLSSLYSDGNALKEHDYELLQLVISNLDACVFNKVGLMKLMLASYSGLGISYRLGKSTDPHEGTMTGRSLFTGKEADVLNQSNHQSIHEKEVNMHSCTSSKKVDEFHNDYSSDNVDFEKDNEMTQAIKKVMKENIQEQGEKHPQTQLYKNLWLEAEARLCSMKYELRLAQMKIELEKSKQQQAKVTDSHGSSNTAMEKSSNSNAIGGSNGDDSLGPKLNENSTENVTTLAEDVTESGHRNPGEVNQPSFIDETKDLESSVMARFKILQNRVENLTSTCKVVQKQLPDTTIDIGVTHGPVPSPWYLERQPDVGVDLPAKVVDLGFAEMRKPWPFINNRQEEGSWEVRKRHDVEHCGVNSIDDIDFCSDVSKQHGESESVVRIADELVSQSVVPRQLGNSLSTGSYDSPSSDWEHVLKEELSS